MREASASLLAYFGMRRVCRSKRYVLLVQDKRRSAFPIGQQPIRNFR